VGAFTYVTAGYIQLADELLRDWGAHATDVSSRVDAGGYDADALAGDVAQTARLSARTAFLVVNEAVEAITVLTMPPARPNEVCSRPYRTPLEAARVELEGSLLLEGNATSRPLPAQVASLSAPTGGAPGTYFRVCADATGYAHGPYFGTVAITSERGVAQMAVNLVVGWGP
jgi:hypothetical protein